MLNIKYEQDNKPVDNKDIFHFKPNDIRYTISGVQVYNFVGFIIENNNMLAVFPKHYFDSEEKLKNINSIKNLFEVIKKYTLLESTKAKADKYIGLENNFQSDYPFAEFYKIYDYYKRYGIYKEEQFIYNKNSNGKISWKRTIQKSNKVISNGNLIYVPLILRKQNFQADFISECMLFVINYTIKNFSFFLDLKPIDKNINKFDFLSNKKYVIKKLQEERSHIFKDNQVQLINNLIKFFEQLESMPKGGSIHFKINHFNLVWEAMIQKYLNDYFYGVNIFNNNIIFDYTKRMQEERFEYQKHFKIDASDNKFEIIPDHYYENEEAIYIFDSKYYIKIRELNYKQFAYTIMIGNSKTGKDKYGNKKKLYSALLLPGSREHKMHIILTDEYAQLNEGCNKIIEQYIDVNSVMLNYLNKNFDSHNIDKEYKYDETDFEDNLMVAENEEDYRYE